MMSRILIVIASALAALSLQARTWMADTLCTPPCPGMEYTFVNQPADYAGPERCTVVCLKAADDSDGRGVLYIHGFNDYFFQTELAEEFVDHGYDFYALDLRKYGRSLLAGQRPFDARSMDEYFADIDSAFAIMKSYGVRSIVLMGHSTGGLLAAYYLEKNPGAPVEALLLNSPFLDWNLGGKEKLVPLVSAIGALFPKMKISQGDGDVYASSLRADRYGEWCYDTRLKMDPSPDVTAGWVRAIDRAQRYVKSHPRAIRVPVLLMYSAASYHGSTWTPQAQREDAVLDVNDIRYWGTRLGTDITALKVNGGLHDLILSAPPVRSALYSRIFAWLNKKLPKK